MKQSHRVRLTFLTTLAIFIGCGTPTESVPERRPRPVVVAELSSGQPPGASLATASVGSWKTEQIGFEVSGRVEFVVEPNTEVESKVLDENGKPIFEVEPIARLESERYDLQVARAKADVTRATQELAAAETELNVSIPAQIRAADASRILAQTELDRSEALFARRAGAEADVDRTRANFESATSQLTQLDAALKAQKAKVESLKSGVLQAEQNFRDAERNLQDCTLFASFRGQIADVSVVPGSVVTAGQPIATIQMMNPIKIELEVSAEESRQLQRTERLPLYRMDGTMYDEMAFLYRVDPVADSLTRTFTVTMLVLNKKLLDEESKQDVATTDDIWRLDFEFLPGAGDGRLFVEEQAMHRDEVGHYVWMITNATVDTRRTTDDSRAFKVRKMRVTPGKLRVQFLGNWFFREVATEDPDFDPAKNFVAGRLKVSEGEPSEWNGDTLMLDSGGQWMLRPGDLVKVDLTAGDQVVGYYVPMDAICRQGSQTFLFAVEESNGETIVKKLPINVVSETKLRATSSLRRIEPVGSGSLEGIRYVTEGAHYLIDGEPVNVILAEASR